jgi:antitoxin Phd
MGGVVMQINTNNLVSITEANQNFSRIARLVDENGAAVILKNNVPRYVVLEYSQIQAEENAENEDVIALGKKILERNIEAFKELAK